MNNVIPDYQPIEHYGIIGDLNTIALIGLNGSIDFMCFPEFHSPSVFVAILDKNKGGNFQIHPVKKEVKYKQQYLPDTNVLLTRFLLKEGVGEVMDFMPIEGIQKKRGIMRRVMVVRGEVSFEMNCNPRFNYARSPFETIRKSENEVVFVSKGEDGLRLKLKSNFPLIIKDGGDVFCLFTLQNKGLADFVLEEDDKDEEDFLSLSKYAETCLSTTINHWKKWMAESNYRGRWIEIINRSALILKLFISNRYGSIIAAPTFSLPENIGGARNWDYRYTWIRDSAFTIYALIQLGYKKEAEAFMNWVEKECEDVGKAGHLGLMYNIDGSTQLNEKILDHLEGYKKSSPVRIGNMAYQQYQLDIYGELMDSVFQFNKEVRPISSEFWEVLTPQIHWLCEHWRDEDNGIWELRVDKKCFIFSRIMCWVALDRAIKIAEHRSFTLPNKWKNERREIFNSIHNEFWNEQLQSFVQFKGADIVDASMLMMPLVKFINPTDPKWLSTLKKIEEDLVVDCLVYRYQHDKFYDGFKKEGTFSMCSFWYIECLSRAGQHDKAMFYFEKMLGYSNHLGLYSEQLGFQGEHLGNFPQAFSHIGLISAALDLNARLDEERKKNKK